MKYVLFVMSLVLCACSAEQLPNSQIKSGGNRVGHFRGFEALSQQFRNSVIDDSGSGQFFISMFLGGYDVSSEAEGLSALLGGYVSRSGETDFINGNPNAVNSMLWSLTMAKIAEVMAAACASENMETISFQSVAGAYRSFKLHDHFATNLKEVCQSSSENVSVEAWQQMWINLVGYEAPFAEYQAWNEDIIEAEYQNTTDRTQDAFLAALMNPFNLLEK